MPPHLPEPGRLVGPNLVIQQLTEDDLPELARIVGDPQVYAHGYVMHHRPTDPAEALAMARERWLADPDQRDGKGRGRLPYAIRLHGDGPLGRAGELVGTSSLGRPTCSASRRTWAGRSTRRASGAAAAMPRPSGCCCATASTSAVWDASGSRPISATPVARLL